jgi:hypothetical protein
LADTRRKVFSVARLLVAHHKRRSDSCVGTDHNLVRECAHSIVFNSP